MRVALDDLGLEHLWIVYPGDEAYTLDDRISVLPIAGIPELAASFGYPTPFATTGRVGESAEKERADSDDRPAPRFVRGSRNPD